MDDDDEIEFDNFNDIDEIIKKTGRLTKPFLEKYEVVKLLAIRSKQLAQGAKAMIKNTQDMSHKEIAKEELKLKVMPLILVRPLPNSEPERWYLRELDYSKVISMIN
jgi:DNA-directed RNA polymerase subunit K/omega